MRPADPRLIAAVAASLTLLASAARAAAPPDASVLPADPDATTHHTLVIDGRTIPYSATAGTIALKDEKGATTARMFYVGYTEDGVTDRSRRPVTFFYNGGPGSSTIWLRMGSFGPKRVVVGDATPSGNPPYRLIDNPYSLLDKSDLVFVDAVGTGFSRIIKGKPADFYGVDPDIRAFGQFVQRYITQNDRWNSPKFLFGESYGTPRSCGLVYELQRNGINVNGVVLLSSVINFQELVVAGDGDDEQYVEYLPTEAAIAWYHHKAIGAPSSLQQWVAQAKSFALGEFVDVLHRGSWASSAEVDDAVNKLHDFTGLSTQFIRDDDLRIAPGEFRKQELHDQDMVTGRYDARFTGVDENPVAQVPDFDPSDSYIEGPFVAAFNAYVRDDLRYRTDLQYKPTAYGDISHWDFDHHIDGNDYPIMDMMPDLRDAMTQNPKLKVFSANGYFDMATPFFGTEYLLAHLGISPALQKNISYGFYESGHMVYLHIPALAQFKSDLVKFYDSAAP
jgi:carboxypeptidase C (cathepsin A)